MMRNRWLSWLVASCLLAWTVGSIGCGPSEETGPQPSAPGPALGAEEPEPQATAEPEAAEAAAPEGAEAGEQAEAAEVAEGPGEGAEAAGGMPPVPVPEDNPMTAEKIELGKLLYFDQRLSADGTVSCATCHEPEAGWAEHRRTSTGIGGQVGPVNAPSVVNAAYAPAQFWDGRAASLEEQALGPIENPKEMGHQLPALVKQLNEIPGYKKRFQKVFGTEVTAEGIAKAIAAFERTIVSGPSPYDRFVAGDADALTADQQEGWELFDGTGCTECHKPPRFSTYEYINAGLGMDKDEPDAGRKAVTGNDADLGKFRVPSLREVADTAPYFHDGSAATLDEAVAVMAGGGKKNPNLSEELESIGGSLSAEEQAKVVEFLKALSSDYPVVQPPELP